MEKESGKESFYKDAQRLFDEKLIYEIYSNEIFSICNLANKCYGIILYKNDEHEHLGLSLVSEEVRKIISNPSFLGKFVASLSEKQLAKYSFYINDKLYETLKKIKEITDIEGPSPTINLEMERELLNIMNTTDLKERKKLLRSFTSQDRLEYNLKSCFSILLQIGCLFVMPLLLYLLRYVLDYIFDLFS